MEIKRDGIKDLMEDPFYQRFPEELPNCVFVQHPDKLNQIVGMEEVEGKRLTHQLGYYFRQFNSGIGGCDAVYNRVNAKVKDGIIISYDIG